MILTSQIVSSFGAVWLDNLPIGAFRHRLISADDAERLIEQARERNALLCLSGENSSFLSQLSALDERAELGHGTETLSLAST